MSPTSSNGNLSYTVRFPQRASHDITQDAEWCELTINGQTSRIRFHDYAAIFQHPGLYEQLFTHELECQSPQTVVRLLKTQLSQLGDDAPRVLDIGAGNGMVGEELRKIGVEYILGSDILPEAKVAAERDRPGVYDEYIVADLIALSDKDHMRFAAARLNCMAVVGALGFGDIPTEAFMSAFTCVADGGLIGFNIKEEFLGDGHGSGFADMVKGAVGKGVMEVLTQERYRHRLSVTGEPLVYVAFVAKKMKGM